MEESTFILVFDEDAFGQFDDYASFDDFPPHWSEGTLEQLGHCFGMNAGFCMTVQIFA